MSLRQRAAEAMKGAVAAAGGYRSGLPSIDHVRKHWARGGWWMSTDGKSVALYKLTIHGSPDRICMVGSGDMSIDISGLDFAAGRFRPTTPDGTNCPWPDEQGRSDGGEVLDFAASLLRLTGPEMRERIRAKLIDTVEPAANSAAFVVFGAGPDVGGRFADAIMALLLADVA